MGEKARILVVNGDNTVRKTIAAMLKAEGYAADTAETGKEAIEKSHANFYNLVMFEIHLPDMLGTALQIKMKETVPPMIKVIIASQATLAKAVDAVNDGADACILIPTSPEKLLNVVKRGLKKQEDAWMFNQQRMSDFIETRMRELTQN